MKKLITLSLIIIIFSSWTLTENKTTSVPDELFSNVSIGEVKDAAKKYYEAGCRVRNGEKPQIKCDFAAGTCKKEKKCTPITTLVYEFGFDDIESISAEYADAMLADGYIDEEDWHSSFYLAFQLLFEYLSSQ
ncbi:MAG: hypothetical protein AMXMBFR79_06670 [Chitinophagaceae bacterium]|nr:hypothetical protein [Chitinophagales bacterium]